MMTLAIRRCAALAAIGLTALGLATAGPTRAEVGFFGYVAVMCGHDDPGDSATLTDYSAEVAGFTNANHVCLPGDPAHWAEHIATAAARFRPILSVEPVFDLTGDGPEGAAAAWFWDLLQRAITDSGIDPGQVIFYVADEPTLRGLDMERVNRAAGMLRTAYPAAEVLLVEACSMAGPPPVPPELTLWGFDCYTIPDPADSPAYMTYLSLSRSRLAAGQRLVLVMDASHTPGHLDAGLPLESMGDVALAYARLALAQPDIAGVIGYTWAGGIDSVDERGVRNMPDRVIAAHRQAGLILLGRD